MDVIKVATLGAGQEIGRSCILVSIGDKNVMLDCGIDVVFTDEKRFPNFSCIADGPLTNYIDCVIISHFHLDHCGALPYLTEVVGYTGPIYMTSPTRAILPSVLEDLWKVTPLENMFYTSENIKNCMKKVITVALHQSVMVDSELEIKAYYAGHVLGAAMFQIKVGSQSVVYTGDFNMTPERHLGAACIDKCRPDLLITESTHATVIRDSKQSREHELLTKVCECIDRGGKVLIPVTALARIQELCIILDTHWERMNLKVPMYFAGVLAAKANDYYKMFISWTNQTVRETFVQRNVFEFKHIKPFKQKYMYSPGPMVVFASSGTLLAGFSLQIFKKWAPDENNMVIFTGCCAVNSILSRIRHGERKIMCEHEVINIKLSVQWIQFSSHADAKGIMQLINNCEPKNVMLVHGERIGMEHLKQCIEKQLAVNCYMPQNGEVVTIKSSSNVTLDVSLKLLKAEEVRYNALPPDRRRIRLLHGVVVVKENSRCLLDVDEACSEVNIKRHKLRFKSMFTYEDADSISQVVEKIVQLIKTHLSECYVQIIDCSISVENVLVKVEDEGDKKVVSVSWEYEQEELGSYVLSLLKTNCSSQSTEI